MGSYPKGTRVELPPAESGELRDWRGRQIGAAAGHCGPGADNGSTGAGKPGGRLCSWYFIFRCQSGKRHAMIASAVALERPI